MTYLVLRTLPLSEFGVFTLAYVSYSLALGVSRAIVGDLLVIRFSRVSVTDRREGVARAAGVAVALGCATGLLAVVASFGLGGTLSTSLLALGAFLPLLLVQDCWRYAFFAEGRPGRAVVNDSVWAVLQFSIMGWMLLATEPTSAAFITAWGLAGAAAAAVGLLQIRIWPDVGAVRSWLRTHGDLAYWFAGESIVGAGLREARWIAVAVVAGTTAIGSVRGSRVPFSPLNVLFQGITPFAIHRGVRAAEHDPHRVEGWLGVLSGLLMVSAIVPGLLMGLVVPDLWMAWLLPGKWPELRPFVLYMTVTVSAEGVIAAMRIGLRVLQDARGSLRAETVGSSVALVVTVAGGVAFGGLGAAGGFALGSVLAAGFWVAMHRRSSRRAATAS